MNKLRIHFVLSLGMGPRCGTLYAKNGTVHPFRVTCGSCKRLMKGEVK